MKARNVILRDHSLNTVLSAIEIYNKPDFKDREQIFAILVVTAWESLLKAQILKNNNNNLRSLYIKDGYRYRPNRNGEYFTIDLEEAGKRCNLPVLVAENIRQLTRIRDAAIHLTSDSKSLPYLTFTLGSASLLNYSRLLRNWFGIGLSDYNFYIMPLGFSYPFQTFTAIELQKEPKSIANILREVARAQAEGTTESDEFYLICEIHTTLVSASKLTEDTDLIASVSSDANGAIIVPRTVNKLDRYPFTYIEVYHRLKLQLPDFMQHELNTLIRERNIKGNQKYSAYNYRSKQAELKGPTRATPVIYNDDFLRLAHVELSRTLK